MTDTRDHASDLAYLRTLAEEGARAPVQGASILLAAGLIFGTASVVHWGIASGVLGLEPSAYGVLWACAGAAFILALILVIARLKRQGGVETAANRAFGSVWSSLGFGMFALFTSLMLLQGSRSGELDMAALSLAIPSIVMALYGVGWAVSATMLKRKALWFIAIAAFAAAPLLALIAGVTEQYLAYAAALYLLMGVPGFLLMRAAKG